MERDIDLLRRRARRRYWVPVNMLRAM